MKRENFLERATFSEDGHSHTFKPLTQGVSPEIYQVSFTTSEVVTAKLEFQDVLDDGDTTLFKHEFTVGDVDSEGAYIAGTANFDSSFQTRHNQLKVTITADDGDLGSSVEVRCIAGPTIGGVNGKGFGTAIAAA